MSQQHSRRKFFQFGAALASSAAIAGCSQQSDPANGSSSNQDQDKSASKSKRPPQGIDMEKWKRLKGEAYPAGSFETPGVCNLPGPNAKRNWPDVDKYKDTKKVPGMCPVSYTHLTLPTKA